MCFGFVEKCVLLCACLCSVSITRFSEKTPFFKNPDHREIVAFVILLSVYFQTQKDSFLGRKPQFFEIISVFWKLTSEIIQVKFIEAMASHKSYSMWSVLSTLFLAKYYWLIDCFGSLLFIPLRSRRKYFWFLFLWKNYGIVIITNTLKLWWHIYIQEVQQNDTHQSILVMYRNISWTAVSHTDDIAGESRGENCLTSKWQELKMPL